MARVNLIAAGFDCTLTLADKKIKVHNGALVQSLGIVSVVNKVTGTVMVSSQNDISSAVEPIDRNDLIITINSDFDTTGMSDTDSLEVIAMADPDELKLYQK